ncbi:Chromatin modification-related YNG2, partial [Paramuricea clavata]
MEKQHQLRSIQQDKARTDILAKLGENSILSTQDWAMKFLQQKYRETQTDWFGKRGISWYISVVVRWLADGKLQHQVFVHIVENCSQDTDVVIPIMQHTLTELKKENPNITSAAYCQDNAGCYHSGPMLAACCLMEETTGITVHQVDFSDPQGVPGSFCTSTFNCGFSAGDFVDITPTRRTKTDKVVDRDADDDDNENEVYGDRKEKLPELFSCPTEGCIKNYHRYSSLESHLEYGVCKLQLERQSLLDKAKAVYVEKLLHGAGEQPVMKSSDTLLDNRNDMLPQGWALRTTKSSKRFNERQKSYLNEKFNIGNETGHKRRRFTLNEFLTPQQIQSYFSRKASKQKKGQVQPVDRPEDR